MRVEGDEEQKGRVGKEGSKDNDGMGGGGGSEEERGRRGETG